MSRTRDAVERAGKLDRAHRTLEVSQQEASKAYAILIEEEPEIAAIVAQVMMRYDKALKALARA